MEKKAGVAILIPYEIDFYTKAVTREKEGPSNSTCGYLSEKSQNTKSKMHIYQFVHCSIFHNSQDIETT